MSTGTANTIGALVVAVLALTIAIVVLALLHHFERTDRRHADRRADWLQYRLDRAHERLGQLVLADKPKPPPPPSPTPTLPTETQRLPRIPSTFAPGTALVPVDRAPARTR